MEALIGKTCMSKQVNFQFLKPGFNTLVVDNRTQGYQKFGVPIGGAMDSVAAEKANWLVGNKSEESLLEITLSGPQIIFKEKSQIALTGADISPEINEKKVEMYETIMVSKGELLTFGKILNGCRAYLSVRGQWIDKNGIKEEGSLLNRLNRIKIKPIQPLTSIRKGERPKIKYNPLVVNVLKGPEYDILPPETINTLFLSKFTLLPDSNRMGYRLIPSLSPIKKSIISSGVVPGTLQITEDGFPILLMKDAPVTGGYTRALNVLSKDLSKLGQLKPGDSLRFVLAGTSRID
ncbi:MAG: biotin-dependent carboxyltransferase family protein [Cyclobacteriaceae bacterium]|nr:biotin-dependent carboxyltransferase family protein [Cyclobacteriaceae bacterium]